MSSIYWDSMLFIYWLENRESFAPQIQKLIVGMNQGRDDLCTSILTLGEVLVPPHREKDVNRIRAVKDYFDRTVRVLPFTSDTADMFAQISAAHRVSPADAIHLASAATAGVDLFVTNDAALRKLRIPGIKFMAALDGKIF